MPRNSQGVYTPPAGTSAVTNTTISSTAYNAFLADISAEMTNSFNVQGTAPMLAALNAGGFKITNLAAGVNPTDAATLLQAQSAIPPGTILMTMLNTPLPGTLACEGSAVSTTTFANLFAVIGFSFGGSGSTFNLPDLRGAFVRGFDHSRGLDFQGNRNVNQFQASFLGNHQHGLTDPGHTHGVNDPTHNHSVSQSPHSHGLTDPGHTHTVSPVATSGGTGLTNGGAADTIGSVTTGSSLTGITMQPTNANVSNIAAATGISNQAAATGASVSNVSNNVNVNPSGSETTVQNYPVLWCIKT